MSLPRPSMVGAPKSGFGTFEESKSCVGDWKLSFMSLNEDILWLDSGGFIPKTINKSIHEPRVNSDELLTDGGIKMARPKTDRKCKAKNETQQEKGNGAKTGIMIVGSIACRLVLLLRAAKLVYRSIRNLIN
ncbi:hypothetical protein O9G_004803 [Rozella allomycis CSF55]|uniref:Uncharacterized protein n=1 Tax=Rozella allomycis (strain CSF55) TaxID=988480 RepID=A0A075AQI5_ROZAC|nr:hypothetical protein O9G_004803 [Rozella allomycis CSF55]|eukprot:EPZ32483.1 hypothetical protein O9G_004803 [Rozella allomycis CSF55]